jgi:hypothetical protein
MSAAAYQIGPPPQQFEATWLLVTRGTPIASLERHAEDYGTEQPERGEVKA